MFAVNAELPRHVRNALPEAAQTRFRLTANSVLAKAGSEKSAINQAWVIVKRDWEKGPDKWVRKAAVIEKKLPADATVQDYIHDFVNSDNPRFDGKSKKERIRMALGAYYSKRLSPDDLEKEAEAIVAGSSSIQGPIHLNGYLNGKKRKKKPEDLAKLFPQTLYVCRYVQNAKDIIAWAKEQGFKTTLPADEMHVTICYSRQPIDWMKVGDSWSGDEKGVIKVRPGGPRVVQPLGTGGAVVLLFSSSDLTWRHENFIKAGASHDFQDYQPHITITWDAEGMDLSKVEPYTGEIVLGPEEFKPLNENWRDSVVEKALYAQQDAGLIQKIMSASGFARMGEMGSSKVGNPYHDTKTGEFTSGPSSGGAKHFTSHLTGRVAAALVTDHSLRGLNDWFANSSADGDASKADKVEGMHAKLMQPAVQHSVAATVAKEIVHSLVVVGVEVAAASALGKVTKLLMPFLTGPAKSLATSAATVVLSRIATRVPLTTSLKVLGAAAGKLVHLRLTKADTITTDDLVTFQLQRLQEVLKNVDPTDLAAQRAEAYLQSTNPEMLQNILNDLEDEGLTDLPTTIADHALDQARVVKVDKSLGLVFGWAIICKRDGQDYYDLNRDANGERVPEHIPEHSMLEATTDFMENSRVHKEMHDGEQRGSVVFAFPLTTDIAKAMGIETRTTGLLVAMKPDKKMLAKYESGELTGFSIGGSRVKSRETVD